MNLNEYLFYAKISRTEAAKLLDINSRYLGQIALGHRKPGRKMKKIIENFTQGKIPMSYWESDEYKQYFEENKKVYCYGNS